jgi:hypothetical protein
MACPYERIPFEWNGLRSTSFAVAHVLFGKPLSTFPEQCASTPFLDLPYRASRALEQAFQTEPTDRSGQVLFRIKAAL